MKALILSFLGPKTRMFYYQGSATFTCHKNHILLYLMYMGWSKSNTIFFNILKELLLKPNIRQTTKNEERYPTESSLFLGKKTSYESPNTQLIAVIEIIFCDLATFTYLDCIISVPITL